jgi:hypothetical protein
VSIGETSGRHLHQRPRRGEPRPPRPFGVYLHGNEGTEGAERGIDSITTGLGWTKAADTVVVSGKPGKDDLESCWNLGATVAAQLME